MPGTWNNKLIVYAHGYVSPTRPAGIPEDQMILPGTNTTIDQLVNAQGYAFATSGYYTTGLAVQAGMTDLLDVVSIFTSLKGDPQQVLLAGVSHGALVTVLALEQHPDIFDGGLALCGPYGSFRGQVDYFGDFRVLFDVFFPGLISGPATDVPAELLDTWETGYYSTTVQPVISDPANASLVDQLLAVAGAAFDSGNAASKIETIEEILWYNIFATNDALDKLGGQPFENQERQYAGSADDLALNQNVARFSADQGALDAIATGYETSGKLTVPLVTMHTTGDPIVPYLQAVQYRGKTIAADNQALHVHIPVNAYGHCRFSALDVLGAFNQLIEMADNPPPYQPVQRAYLPVIEHSN
jgi:pimeloyl-ACP methyl ester carboxylesterase